MNPKRLFGLVAVNLLLLFMQYAAVTTLAATSSVQQNCTAKDAIREIAISPDGNYVLATWVWNSAKLWRIDTGEAVHTFTHEGVPQSIRSVGFSPDGQSIFTGGLDSVLLWDFKSGKQLKHFDRTVKDDPYGTIAVISPDGRYLLAGGYDGSTLWNIKSGKLIHVFADQMENPYKIQFSSDGKHILTGGNQLWNVETGLLEHIYPPTVFGMISNNGASVLTTDINGLHVWDIRTYQEVVKLPKDILAWYLSPNDHYLLAIDIANDYLLFDLQQRKLLKTFAFKLTNSNYAAFFPDNERLLISNDESDKDTGKDYTVWSIPENKELQTFMLDQNWLTVFKISANGKFILGGTYDGQVLLWDTSNGKQLRAFC
jgi:WD40 repeat protein